MRSIVLFFSILCLLSCEQVPKGTASDLQTANTQAVKLDSSTGTLLPTYHFPYQLDKPDESFKLSSKLVEISGLSLSSDSQYLLAVNDEQGKAFFVDKQDGEIKKDLKFGKSGDYEGIEMVENILYVVRNSGTIVEVKDLGEEKQKDETYNTELNAEYDVEGLGYDAKHNRLLLACKGKAGVGEQFRHTRAVYGFDLNKKALNPKPVWLIDRRDIRAYAEKKKGKTPKLIEILDKDSSNAAFAPSGIAVHPISGEIYLISSVGKVLVVIKPNGKLAYLEKLDESLFRQPEGICFEADGTLFISSEGKGGKGRIFRFNPI